MNAAAAILGAMLDALEGDAELRARLRAALGLGPGAGDEVIPLQRAAAMVGTSTRALRLAARRGDLAIEGPRAARVVRRGELDRWLAAQAPASTRVNVANDADEDDDRAAARAAVAAAAARARRGSR